MSNTIITNSIITKGRPFNGLIISKFVLNPIPEETPFGILRSLATLNSQFGVPSVPLSMGLASFRSTLPISTLKDFSLDYQGDFRLDPLKDQQIIREFGHLLVKNAAIRKGFDKQESAKLFGEKPDIFSDFSSFNGMHYRVEVLPDGNLLVTIDPTSRWFQTIPQYLHSLGNQGLSYQDLDQSLKNLQVLIPSYKKRRWFSGSISRILPISSQDCVLEDGNSLYDFWQGKHQRYFLDRWQLSTSPTSKVVGILIGEIRLVYPIDILRVPIDLSIIDVKKGRIYSTHDRLKKTRDLVSSIFGEPINLGSLNITFNSQILESPDLESLGFSFRLFSPPVLEFGNNITKSLSSSRDVDFGLRQGGPFSGSKEIGLHYIIPPEICERSDYPDCLDQFHSELNLGATTYKLGKFVVRSIHCLNSASPLSYFQVSESIIPPQGFSATDIAVIILPQKQNSRCYRMSKKGLGSHGFRSKAVTSGTFDLLALGLSPRAKNSARGILALSLYARTIVPGEGALLLAPGVRGLKPNIKPLTLSIDISRDIQRKEEVAADMICMNERGLLLDVGGSINFREGVIKQEVIRDWVLERTSRAYQISQKLGLDSPNAIIHAYDGALKISQRDELLAGLASGANELIEEGIFPKESTTDILEITKNVPDRLYAYNRQRLPEGTAVITPSGFVFLLASKPYGGTPQLLRLRITPDGSSAFSNIFGVGQFVHDMRYLDPVSPYVQPRLPIFAHTVHNKSNALRYGKVPYITF